jgi:hypothetical protein
MNRPDPSLKMVAKLIIKVCMSYFNLRLVQSICAGEVNPIPAVHEDQAIYSVDTYSD